MNSLVYKNNGHPTYLCLHLIYEVNFALDLNGSKFFVDRAMMAANLFFYYTNSSKSALLSIVSKASLL